MVCLNKVQKNPLACDPLIPQRKNERAKGKRRSKEKKSQQKYKVCSDKSYWAAFSNLKDLI